MGTKGEKCIKGDSKDLGFFFKGEDGAIYLDSGIEVGLVFTNWSEKSDCGFIRSNGEPV